MYSFIYYFLYQLAKKRNPDAKFATASVLAATQFGHFLLINSILKIFFRFPVIQFSEVYLYNKLAWMPFAIIWLIITHVYFKKKFETIKIKIWYPISNTKIFIIQSGIEHKVAQKPCQFQKR